MESHGKKQQFTNIGIATKKYYVTFEREKERNAHGRPVAQEEKLVHLPSTHCHIYVRRCKNEQSGKGYCQQFFTYCSMDYIRLD